MGVVKLSAEKDIADKIAAAKAKLVVVEPKPISPYAALGAAALAATAAAVMAGGGVPGPGGRLDEPPATYRASRLPVRKRQASSAARIGARALCWVSAYSAAGSLSETTPAPAWTKIWSSANRAVRRVMQM